MLSLRIELLDEKAGRPMGNPFKVRAVRADRIGPKLLNIHTGICLQLPECMGLEVHTLHPSVVFLNHRFELNGELCVAVHCAGKLGDEPFATVYVVERKVLPVRFIEVKDGKRTITGAPVEATPEDKDA